MAVKTPPTDEQKLPRSAPTVERSPVPKPVIAFFAALRKVFGKPEHQREVIQKPDTVAHRGSWEVEVQVEPDELDGGFVAEVLGVPGAMAQGETEQEAVQNVKEALKDIIDVRVEEHLVRCIDPPVTKGAHGRVWVIDF
jgi:predicted RNase H-like HicB family nuclease